MKKLLVVCALLGGCASKGVPVAALQTQVVYKPVLKSCVPADIAPAPMYPDSKEALLAAQSAAERYRLLFAGRLLRSERLGELESIIQECK